MRKKTLKVSLLFILVISSSILISYSEQKRKEVNLQNNQNVFTSISSISANENNIIKNSYVSHEPIY